MRAIPSGKSTPSTDRDAYAVNLSLAWQFTNQLPWIHTEPPGDLHDVVQRDVAPPTLDLTEVSPMQTDHLGGLLLTQPEFATARHHAAPELSGGG